MFVNQKSTKKYSMILFNKIISQKLAVKSKIKFLNFMKNQKEFNKFKYKI